MGAEVHTQVGQAVQNSWMVTVAEVVAAHLGIRIVSYPEPNAKIRWVATNEMAEPSPFLEGGELLLTTGLLTADWTAERWATYVRDLVDADVCALGFATGDALAHEVLPADLAHACERVGLNLLEIPIATSFVSISQAVAKLLEDQDRIRARESSAVQRRLAQAARRREVAHAIAEELARYVKGGVWILNAEGQDLAMAGRVKSGQSSASHREAILHQLSEMRSRGVGGMSTWAMGSARASLQPLGLHEPAEAYLAVVTGSATSDYERIAIQTSASLLSLELERRFERREAMRRLHRQAFELLLENEVRAAELVLAAVDAQHESLRLPTVVNVIRATGAREELQRLLVLAERTTGPVFAVESSDGQQLHILSASVRKDSVVHSLSGASVRIGVGSTVRIHEVERSFASAGFALQQTSPTRPVVFWAEMTDWGLAALVDPKMQDAFADELLSRLDATRSGRDELMRVASSFIRHHGRIHTVATELTMHRNSVRSRVREIEEALRADLDDPTTLLSLWAALQINLARS